MEVGSFPWSVVLFCVANLGLLVAFMFWVKYSIQALQSKVKDIEKEYTELKKQLQDMRDILVKVENNTHLLMLGRIKTGNHNNKESNNGY